MDKNESYDEGKINKDEIQQFEDYKAENKFEQNWQQKSIQKQQQTKILLKKAVRWTTLERIRYLIFVINYKQTLQSKDLGQKRGICVKMSRFIETKEKNVCSEHHSDLMSRYKSIDGVIEFLKKILHFDKETVQKQVLRIEKFILEERQRQYNAVNVLNKQNYPVPYRQIFDFQSINSEIYINVILREKEEGNNQQQNYIINEKIFDIEIPMEVILVISKSELGQQKRNIKKFSSRKRQNMEIVKNIELDESKEFMREIPKKVDSNLILKSNEIKKQKKIKQPATDIKVPQNALQTQIYHQISSSEMFCQSNSGQLYEQVKKQMICEQLESEKISVQKDKVKRKTVKSKTWTISEKIKLIIFLNAYKQNFESKDLRLKSGIMDKLCRYIGTNKTKNQCHHRLMIYKKKYNYNYSRIVEEQKKRLRISEELIDKQKIFIQKMNQLPISKRYDLKLAASTIIHHINKKDVQLNPSANIRLSLNPQLSCILTQEQIDEQKQKINLKDSHNQLQDEFLIHQIQQKNGKIKKYKEVDNSIKQKYTIKVDPDIFRKLSRSFKNKTYSEKGFQLVDFSKNNLIVKTKVKQSVRIVFIDDEPRQDDNEKNRWDIDQGQSENQIQKV